jgi:hypothetical protein
MCGCGWVGKKERMRGRKKEITSEVVRVRVRVRKKDIKIEVVRVRERKR